MESRLIHEPLEQAESPVATEGVCGDGSPGFAEDDFLAKDLGDVARELWGR